MRWVQLEVIVPFESLAYPVEFHPGDIDDQPAVAALRVQVILVPVSDVIDGAAMAKVHVLHHRRR